MGGKVTARLSILSIIIIKGRVGDIRIRAIESWKKSENRYGIIKYQVEPKLCVWKLKPLMFKPHSCEMYNIKSAKRTTENTKMQKMVMVWVWQWSESHTWNAGWRGSEGESVKLIHTLYYVINQLNPNKFSYINVIDYTN